MNKFEKLIWWFLILILGVMLGYAWRMVQIAYAYEAPVKAGWALPKTDPVRLAMDKMGPLYPYMMAGEKLYVKPNEEWLRLRYRER